MNFAPFARRARIIILAAVFWVLGPVSASADLAVADIPDDSSLRAAILDSWFRAPPAEALSRKSERRLLDGGDTVEIRIEQGKDEFMVVLARERDGRFPAWSQGSWVLYRRRSDGSPTRIRVFLRSDPYAYIQFRPGGAGRTVLDAVAYGAYLARGAVVSQAFDRLLSLPLSRALSSAGSSFPIRYFEAESGDYADARFLREAIRSRLPELSYADDGAFDEAGRPVFIETLEPQGEKAGLNCSGFAKWVVDGMLRPLTGRRLGIAELKAPMGERGTSFSEPYEDALDPYFGLDWTRNLAAAAAAAVRGSGSAALSEIEVRQGAVAALRLSGDPNSQRSYLPYMKDVGFAMEGLKATLFGLAVDEPGRMYLASINAEVGDEPRLRRHFHVAVLMPLFEEDGRFTVTVFESAAETDFDAFVRRYPLMHANLVRLPVESTFAP